MFLLAKNILELALMQADTSSIVPLLKAAAALQLTKQISAKHRNSKLPKWLVVLTTMLQTLPPLTASSDSLTLKTITLSSLPQRSNTAAGRQYFAISQA